MRIKNRAFNFLKVKMLCFSMRSCFVRFFNMFS